MKIKLYSLSKHAIFLRPGRNDRAFFKTSIMRYILLVLLPILAACGRPAGVADLLPGNYTITAEIVGPAPSPEVAELVNLFDYSMAINQDGTAQFTVDAAGEGIHNTQTWSWSMEGDSIAFNKPDGNTDRYLVSQSADGWTLANSRQIFHLKKK